MKILQLGKFYPVQGGIEKVMYDLTVGLSERGVDCDMMCALSEGGSQIVRLNDHARLIGCHTRVKASSTMISPAMVRALKKRCGEYDVIHVHLPDPMACLAVFLSGYKGKMVLHWHSDIQRQKFLLRLFGPLQKWMLGRADLVVGTSPAYTSQSPFLAGVQDKVTSLPIGVDPVVPEPDGVEAVKKMYPGKKIVFSLGRLVEYKGFKWLIGAAGYLSDDYVVLIGGDGPLKKRLQADISSRGLEDKVKLLGRISCAELPSYYGACTLFCLSSVQKTEAFGIVLIEAMSCGKPVVATNIPQSGVSWVNEHEVSGLNVEPKDSKGLADAIMSIAGDSRTYSEFSAGAQKRYRDMFTKERMIDDLLDIYDRL